MNLVFYVAHYPVNESAQQMLATCLEGIRKYYPISECHVLYTPSQKPVDIDPRLNISVGITPILNSSVVGCFKHYIDSGSTKKALFFHDSMIMKGPFNEEILSKPFGFMWFFNRWDTHSLISIECKDIKTIAYTYLSNVPTDWVGCFGCSLFSDRESLSKLWNVIDFPMYPSHPKRATALMDLERIIGIFAYGMGLIPQGEIVALCGDIFEQPMSFDEWYSSQSQEKVEEMFRSYSVPVVKAWCRRHIKDAQPPLS